MIPSNPAYEAREDMSPTAALCFGPYRLAGPKGPLTRDGAEVALRSKTLQVLWYLARHAGEVVEPGRLFAAVWPDRVVSAGVLAVSIRELRLALDDDSKAPRYIQTLHRHGYRFIAPVQPVGPAGDLPDVLPPHWVLGREAELRRLNDCYRRARQGQRQFVFVTGEVGIGKSTLAAAWVRPLLADAEVWLGLGQCVEHSGVGEVYLVLLEALNRLCRGPQGEAVIAVLRQQAPGWLAQLPGVLAAADREALQHQQAPVTAHHYQRELADALEALSVIRPVVLMLEDLHWCDQATVEALAVLARRPESARLMVIGTYRWTDLTARDHPLRSLKQELACHGQCQELALEGLNEVAVRTYVAQRLPSETAAAVAGIVYQRSGGQPLFMVSLTEYMTQSPTLASQPTPDALAAAAATLPSGLQQIIEAQVERLSTAEQQLLEAASVVGLVFAAAAVAAALDLAVGGVEEVCDGLVRRESLIAAQGLAEWPDGTLSESYRFRHGLYQEVLYRRIASNRRIHLHRAIGERLARGYGSEADAVAVELAEHFEQGRDDRRAVRYHCLAGETALRRYAAQAARAHLSRGLELLSRLPQDAERAKEELHLQVLMGVAAIATEGFGSAAVAYAYGRAHALCRQFPSTLTLQSVLCGLWNYFLTRADLEQARSLAAELSTLIARAGTRDGLFPAHNAVGQTALFGGEPSQALGHIDAVLGGYYSVRHRGLASQYGEDPGVVCHMYAALADWLLGYPDRAARRIEDGLKLARGLGQPFGVAQIFWSAVLVAHGRGDLAAVQSHALELIALCEQEDIAMWLDGGRILLGWAHATEGLGAAGVAAIQQGLGGWEAAGTALIRPYHLALLADAYGRQGQWQDAIDTVSEALATAERTGERWYEAELHRLRAELMRRRGGIELAAVEAELQQALDIAQQQQARALALRAATSLARLWCEQGRRGPARDLLAPVYAAFTEGWQTRDLREAQALLAELL
jgi:predicted ATPase/DNA-binding winged helix-turn-helix (wHTH) protein